MLFRARPAVLKSPKTADREELLSKAKEDSDDDGDFADAESEAAKPTPSGVPKEKTKPTATEPPPSTPAAKPVEASGDAPDVAASPKPGSAVDAAVAVVKQTQQPKEVKIPDQRPKINHTDAWPAKVASGLCTASIYHDGLERAWLA